MIGFIYKYGVILQLIAIVHFVRRRPDGYWLFIILVGGGLGALAYIVIEAIPDFVLLRGAFQMFPRRKRIKELQAAVIDNPSIGNYEELGDLYLDDKQYAQARECLDRVVSSRTAQADSPDPLYRRALAAYHLGDLKAALADLDEVFNRDPRYDYQRAAALRAYVVGQLGDRERAAQLFAEVTETSTLSETQYNYAVLLADLGRDEEARDWANRILAKRASMPNYQRRMERPWFRKAKALLKRLSKV
jgi:hypothetical protein